ncbi:carbohydrate sulfotransferase 3-like [Ptychodera flava]|uniref:carbohydrate sulfotransferase 3-like n=1 Tax=Ptychodera flava TaxID=63121 RepID=UPI003969F393
MCAPSGKGLARGFILSSLLLACCLRLLMFKGRYPRSGNHGTDSTITHDLPGKHQISQQVRGHRVNVMIHARKRSGSSVTGTFFGKNPDFFYFYEPGWIVSHQVRGITREDFEFLETIRPQLLSFLDGIYSCNFTQHEYFIEDVNNVNIFRVNSELPFESGPMTIDKITRFCLSKKHVITKVLRIYNIISAAPLIRKHDIKVIFLVRDPRGLTKSRETFYPGSKGLVKEGELYLSDRLRTEIVDYCRWLEVNYMAISNGPDWLRNNTRLVRYEDIFQRPLDIVPQLYEFTGIATDDVIRNVTEEVSDQKPGNAEAWRKGVTFKNVQAMQGLCPDRVWKMFGYRLVDSAEILHNDDVSLVETMPNVGPHEFQDIYYNKKYQ